VWALELLPAYDAVARMKAQAHWQTDVLAGWALGTEAGYLATRWEMPIFVQILPRLDRRLCQALLKSGDRAIQLF
jgi:hypothetical protein